MQNCIAVTITKCIYYKEYTIMYTNSLLACTYYYFLNFNNKLICSVNKVLYLFATFSIKTSCI